MLSNFPMLNMQLVETKDVGLMDVKTTIIINCFKVSTAMSESKHNCYQFRIVHVNIAAIIIL